MSKKGETNSNSKFYTPKRIVCLTEETTETLYLLGEQDRIVGISGFTVRPPQARKEKPKVSTFLDAQIDEIKKLNPDLVIGFSDIQAGIAEQLIKEGITVWVNNHRTIKGILDMIFQLGSIVGKSKEALELIEHYKSKLDSISSQTAGWDYKPKVYFEEWYDPLISGIQWVDEVIEICGGENVFAENARQSLAKDRIIEDEMEVVRRNPDIILASWCGKAFKKDRLINREGWKNINAVKTDHIYEIDSSIILQPGPACLADGIDKIYEITSNYNSNKSAV